MHNLSNREKQLCSVLVNKPGMPEKLQAEALGVSHKTVSTMHQNIKKKLGAKNIVEVAIMAVLAGMRHCTVVAEIKGNNPLVINKLRTAIDGVLNTI